MRPIYIDNFSSMNPDSPQYSDNNQHYLISGANPTYYNDIPDSNTYLGIQEEQIAPLAASHTWNKIIPSINGNIVINDVTESLDSHYDVYTIDNYSTTYGLDLGTGNVTQFSQPSGNPETCNLAKVKCYNNYLLATTNTGIGSQVVYKMPLPGNSSWTTCTGSLSPVNEEHFMEKFLEYCMISNAYSKILKIDASFSILPDSSGIDLGTGWKVTGMKNYNDKYLVIAGTQGGYSDYLFLWNGRSSTYNYSVKISGKFIDMKVIDGTLYVAVLENGGVNTSELVKTTIYYLKGYQLVPLFTPQISPITIATPTSFKGALFNFQNKLAIRLNTKDIMIYGKGSKFIISGTNNFSKFSDTYGGYICAIEQGTNVASTYYYNFESQTYNNISYTSQWIPVKNPSRIDIIYDTPPQSVGDAINVTVYGRGEDIISGNSTTSLTSITPSTILNNTRTPLQLQGFAGDKMKIVLSTTNTTWQPIIRGVHIY